MKLSADLTLLQSKLGYVFQNRALLIRAVTHSSMSSDTRDDNQRLEFLGDRVLGLVMAEALLAEDTSAREGQLAPRFNALVRKEACAEVAKEIGLAEALKLGRSEMLSGGRRKQALLGDAMEAVLAAVYLDGGFEAARKVVLATWGARVQSVEADARDPKTTLQEWAQARGMPPPSYTIISRTGPDHAPEFVIEAKLKTGETAQAKAGSKRLAEHAAAKTLLEQVSNG